MMPPGKAWACRVLARFWFKHKLLANMMLMAMLLFTFGGLVILMGAAFNPWWQGAPWSAFNIGCAVALSVLAPLLSWGFLRFMSGLERLDSGPASRVQELLFQQGLSSQSLSNPSRMEAWLVQQGFEPLRRAQERAARLESALPVMAAPALNKSRL